MTFYDYTNSAQWEFPAIPNTAEEVYLVLELSPAFYNEGCSDMLSPSVFYQDTYTTVLNGGEAEFTMSMWQFNSPFEHIVITPDNPWVYTVEVSRSDMILAYIHATFNIITKQNEPSDYVTLKLERFDSSTGNFVVADLCECYVTDIYGASAASLSHAYNIRLVVYGMSLTEWVDIDANVRGTWFRFTVSTSFDEAAINQYNIVAYALGMHDHSTYTPSHNHQQEYHFHQIVDDSVLALPSTLTVTILNQDNATLYTHTYTLTTGDSPDCPPPIEIDITPYVNNTDPTNNAYYLECAIPDDGHSTGVYIRPKIRYTHW